MCTTLELRNTKIQKIYKSFFFKVTKICRNNKWHVLRLCKKFTKVQQKQQIQWQRLRNIKNSLQISGTSALPEIYVTLMQGKFMSATKLCCWVHKLCLLFQYLLEKGKFFHYLIFEIHIILRKRLLFTAELVISQQAIYIPHHLVCSTSKLNLLRRKKRNT